MGEFGSNNDDNERKEKTSERAREREGGGERGRALVRAGVEKEKGKKKERTLLLRERSFPPPSSLFSVSSFSSFRKKIREKYMQKTEREAFFESGARGRVEDEKAREREDGRGRGFFGSRRRRHRRRCQRLNADGFLILLLSIFCLLKYPRRHEKQITYRPRV